MKTISLMILFSFSFLSMNGEDTLVVVTKHGTHILVVDSQKRLISPAPDFSSAVLFSTEGLPHLVESSGSRLEYSFQKKQENQTGTLFDWWSLSVLGSFSQEIVNFDTRPKKSGYIMYPLTWSQDCTSLYFFSTNNDALDNQKGIFKYDFQKRSMKEIVSADSYSRVPLVNDQRTALYFLREDFDGQKIVYFDLQTESEKILLSGVEILRLGILSSFSSTVFGGNNCLVDPAQPELKSPFRPFVNFCVTRMGFENVLVCSQACEFQSQTCSPAPYCEGHCSLGCVNCRDAVDMDVLVDSYLNRILVASSDGYVVRAQSICPVQGMGQGYGFGYHVVIRHGGIANTSAPETLYAHLSDVFVEEGQFVYAGQYIGILGASQVNDCTGDGVLDCDCTTETGAHIHFEYHSGTAGLYSTTDIFAPTFVDIGDCVMQPNNSYSGNTSGISEEDIYPNASEYEIVSIEPICGGFVEVTVVGETCSCCESVWYPYNNNQSVSGDTVVVFLSENMVTNQCYSFGRTVFSSCVNSSSATDAIMICLDAEDFVGCVPGCVDVTACNYNPQANHDDGSCDFSCLGSCELADITNDAVVNIQDVLFVLNSIGPSQGPGDVNGDGTIGISDLLIVFSFFGSVCD